MLASSLLAQFYFCISLVRIGVMFVSESTTMLHDIGFTRGLQLQHLLRMPVITTTVMLSVMLNAQIAACQQHHDVQNITR